MHRLKLVLVGVLAVVVVLCGGVVGWSRFSGDEDGGGPEQAPLEEARSALAQALSYDYRHLDRDKQRALATMTEGFAAEFGDTFARTAAVMAPENKAVVQAKVHEVGAVTLGAHRATILAYVDQVRREQDSKAKPQIVQSRVVVEMRLVEGRWLIAGLRPF